MSSENLFGKVFAAVFMTLAVILWFDPVKMDIQSVSSIAVISAFLVEMVLFIKLKIKHEEVVKEALKAMPSREKIDHLENSLQDQHKYIERLLREQESLNREYHLSQKYMTDENKSLKKVIKDIASTAGSDYASGIGVIDPRFYDSCSRTGKENKISKVTLDLKERSASKKCAFCHENLDEAGCACPQCGVEIHEDCFKESLGCVTYGCSGKKENFALTQREKS